MPTYEYVCLSCGHRFEQFQTMTEPSLSRCPECGEEIQRLIGAGMGVIFKGSGFYQTDYKSNTRSGKTCCGRSERCEKPPCSDEGTGKK